MVGISVVQTDGRWKMMKRQPPGRVIPGLADLLPRRVGQVGGRSEPPALSDPPFNGAGREDRKELHPKHRLRNNAGRPLAQSLKASPQLSFENILGDQKRRAIP